MPYIIAALAVLFILTLIFYRSEKVKVGDNVMKKIGEETISDLICDGCLRSKNVDCGKGINPAKLMPTIKKATNSIGKRIKRNNPVSEGEKWLYENFYLIYRYVYSRKDDLKSLPHINDLPRIVFIAKGIVNNSLDTLTGERVRKILSSVNDRVLLKYDELMQFNNAIYYALTEQAYILARRILRQHAMESTAEKFVPTLFNSDVYLYFLMKNKKLSDKKADYLRKKGISEKKVTTNYNKTVLYNATLAKTVFVGMREAESFVTAEYNVKFLGSYKILAEKFDLQSVSVNTLKDYFSVVSDVSKSCGAEEDYVAEIASEIAVNNDKDISTVLFDYKRELKKAVRTKIIPSLKPKYGLWKQRVYVISVILPSLCGAACIAAFFNLVIGVLSFVPLIFITENLINYALNGMVKDKRAPEKNAKAVSANDKVAVVVSEFITSSEQFDESLKHIRLLRASNGGENVEFCLLVDTKGGNTPVNTVDNEIIERIKTNGLEEDISVFLRKKSFIGNKYVAHERKRGALNALNKLFVTGNSEDFYYIGNPNYFIPKYVVTLDADNSLFTGDVLEMVNMMSHPYNKKYDLMTLHSRYDLFSLKTVYSKRFLSESGTEEYPVYSDLFYRAFGRDIYCGKGIYRPEAFYKKIDGIFPSGKILSHDIIEGSVLSTGGATTALEEAPNGFLSDRERKKRWIRGDIQLLPFLFGRWKNDENKTCRQKIEPFYRYIMAKNALCALKATFLAATVLYGLFTGVTNLLFAIGLFFTPYVIDVIKALRNLSCGARIRYVFSDAMKKIVFSIEDAFTLWYYAFDNLKLFLGTIFAMITKKDLLSWKTYRESQSERNISAFFKEFTPSFAVLTTVAIGLYFVNPTSIFIFAYLFGAIIAYTELYVCSENKIKSYALSERDKKTLLRYAEKTYKYFSYTASYDALIGDNLQIKPYKGVATVTSPTNIGFSLIARISAYYLGIIDYKECVDNLNSIISTIDKLPKWKGNLYNWYDINTKKPVNRFVSSVDSGNLVACLIVCREFYKKHNDDVNELKTDLLIINTDLEALYDESKKLFFIGYDGENYVGHYDLLNSESRILSTIFMAYKKNTDNFRCLQRDYSSYGGNTLLSWSGTAFETLMPSLFISAPRYSLIYDTENNVAKAQCENRYNGLFGIGESGFYSLDEQLRYQYYAFGIRRLSLKNENTLPVISPYSSAICLKYRPKETIKNLIKSEENGMVDEYGFFEAYDMRKGGGKVYSHMTHHQGMILCAIADLVENGVINELFSNDEKIAATLKNYNEITSRLKNSRYLPKNKEKYNIENEKTYKYIDKLEEYLHVFALNDGDYKLFINAFGGGFAQNGAILCGKFGGIYEENNGSFFLIKGDDGKIFSPTYLPLTDECRYSVKYFGNEIILENSTKKLVEKVSLLTGLNGETRYFECSENNAKIAFFSSVTLNTLDAYNSHPTYNGLFIEAKTVGQDCVILRRRKKSENEKDSVLGVKVCGVKNLRFECNAENFLGRNGSLRKPKVFSDEDKTAPSTGDVLNPCVGFTGTLMKNNCCVSLIYGENESEVINGLNSLPEDTYSFALLSDGKIPVSTETCDVISEIIYLPYRHTTLSYVIKNGKTLDFLNKCKGKKLVLYKYNAKANDKFEKFLSMCDELKLLGINASFIVEIEREETETVKKYLSEKILSHHISDCEICFSDENMQKYAFITLNYDLSFRKTKYVPDKKFELIKETSEKRGGEILRHGATLYRSGSGGFDENDDYIVEGSTLLPYANVIGAEYGGMITTNNGGGFFYFDNSRENKMNKFDNDPITDDFSEFLYVKTADGCHRLNCGDGENRFVTFEKGKTVFVSKINRVTCTVKYATICNGKGRTITVDAVNGGGYAEFIYGLYPSLSWYYEPAFLSCRADGNLLTITNIVSGNRLYIKFLAENLQDITFHDEERSPYCEYFTTAENVKFRIVFSQDKSLIESVTAENVSYYEAKDKDYFDGAGNVSVVSPFRSFNVLLKWLPYQVVSSRINAKAGFYQVGGATGFRDKLQDGLSVMHFSPEKTKEIILEAAKHQYFEGDVMHWWHEPKFGLRTKITDDKLFLPLAVAEYVEFSGDYGILDTELPYLDSPVMSEHENTRYENPRYTERRESLRKHCLKAIKSSLRYGEHGLLVMGSGDWNDGMDEICRKGKGESVFNSMLCYEVTRKFGRICDEETEKDLSRIGEELKAAVNSFAFDRDRYMRLFSDAGKWYGQGGNEVLSLDILTQSYAVISGIADEKRAKIVLDTAKSLVDENAGIIKLLSPPLKEKSGFGYISAYPQGVRENGGQYTHAAVWYLIALTRAGREDEAFDLFMMINPVEKCRKEDKNLRYKGEPYVFAGDIYSNEQNYGRMGWSWYTGSAGWAYRLIVEEFFGLKRRGKKLYIEPRLPKKLSSSVVTYKFNDSVYSIEYKSDEEFSVEVNGEKRVENYVTLEDGILQKIVVCAP